MTNILESFDACDWAAEFMRIFGTDRRHEIDEELMRGWFANALMKGFDEHSHRITPQISKMRRDAAGLATAIIDHIRNHTECPVPVAEMSEREKQIFDMLAADRGLLIFMAEYLRTGLKLGDADGNLPPEPPDFYENLYRKVKIDKALAAIDSGTTDVEAIKAILVGYDD